MRHARNYDARTFRIEQAAALLDNVQRVGVVVGAVDEKKRHFCERQIVFRVPCGVVAQDLVGGTLRHASVGVAVVSPHRMLGDVAAAVDRRDEREARIRAGRYARKKAAPRNAGESDAALVDAGRGRQKRMCPDDRRHRVVRPLVLDRVVHLVPGVRALRPAPLVGFVGILLDALHVAADASVPVHRNRRIAPVVPVLDPAVEGAAAAAMHEHHAGHRLAVWRLRHADVGEDTRLASAERHVLVEHGLHSVGRVFRRRPDLRTLGEEPLVPLDRHVDVLLHELAEFRQQAVVAPPSRVHDACDVARPAASVDPVMRDLKSLVAVAAGRAERLEPFRVEELHRRLADVLVPVDLHDVLGDQIPRVGESALAGIVVVVRVVIRVAHVAPHVERRPGMDAADYRRLPCDAVGEDVRHVRLAGTAGVARAAVAHLVHREEPLARVEHLLHSGGRLLEVGVERRVGHAGGILSVRGVVEHLRHRRDRPVHDQPVAVLQASAIHGLEDERLVVGLDLDFGHLRRSAVVASLGARFPRAGAADAKRRARATRNLRDRLRPGTGGRGIEDDQSVADDIGQAAKRPRLHEIRTLAEHGAVADRPHHRHHVHFRIGRRAKSRAVLRLAGVVPLKGEFGIARDHHAVEAGLGGAIDQIGEAHRHRVVGEVAVEINPSVSERAGRSRQCKREGGKEGARLVSSFHFATIIAKPARPTNPLTLGGIGCTGNMLK